MGIKIPGYRLEAPRDLKEMRYRLKGGGKHRNLHQELTLTTMIDMFAVIIIFLIQSFSATGEVLLINKNVELPTASQGQPLKRAPIITVMRDKVTLEGIQVGDNVDIEDLIEETDWTLPLLTQQLLEYKKFYEVTNTDSLGGPEVILQADRETEFLYIKRVLFTLTKIGFGNINLAVRGAPTQSSTSFQETEEL